jgi:transcriptional regulator with XRE-family HTH domain
MFDTSKLRGRIVEKFGSQNAFAEAAHRSVSFVSQYLNGKVSLDQKIIDEWTNLLDIPVNEIDLYFFNKKVHETEH